MSHQMIYVGGKLVAVPRTSPVQHLADINRNAVFFGRGIPVTKQHLEIVSVAPRPLGPVLPPDIIQDGVPRDARQPNSGYTPLVSGGVQQNASVWSETPVMDAEFVVDEGFKPIRMEAETGLVEIPEVPQKAAAPVEVEEIVFDDGFDLIEPEVPVEATKTAKSAAKSAAPVAVPPAPVAPAVLDPQDAVVSLDTGKKAAVPLMDDPRHVGMTLDEFNSHKLTARQVKTVYEKVFKKAAGSTSALNQAKDIVRYANLDFDKYTQVGKLLEDFRK